MKDQPKCKSCNDTGWYGDKGPGRSGNTEYIPCDTCQTPNLQVQREESTIARLESELATNAKLLAAQCDRTMEWESRAMKAERQLDEIKESIKRSDLIEVEATTVEKDGCGTPLLKRNGKMLVPRGQEAREKQYTLDLQAHANTARKLVETIETLHEYVCAHRTLERLQITSCGDKLQEAQDNMMAASFRADAIFKVITKGQT